MLLPLAAMAVGIVILVWGADRFVEGAVSVAVKLGMSQLFIGMVVVGFGTSVPEMLVSALASFQGNSGIALGNAYGSNIANITLILGATALINPTPVHSSAVKREIPILLLVTAFAIGQLWLGNSISRFKAVVLLLVFGICMFMSYRHDKKGGNDIMPDAAGELEHPLMPLNKGVFWVFAGLLLLIGSSRLLVWGAVETATILGISDLTIGLTVVAVGTSLPEFASSLAAARKNRHDIVVGNIVGSNLFNTLVVVGIAGLIRPIAVDPIILSRDMIGMAAATIALYFVCVGRGGKSPIITRAEGGVLLAMYIAYTGWVIATASH